MPMNIVPSPELAKAATVCKICSTELALSKEMLRLNSTLSPSPSLSASSTVWDRVWLNTKYLRRNVVAEIYATVAVTAKSRLNKTAIEGKSPIDCEATAKRRSFESVLRTYKLALSR